MADTATVSTTAAASKKKYKNKKKAQQQTQKSQPELEQGPGPAVVKADVHQPNGHVQSEADDADVALINGIMQRVQLFNGHIKKEAMAELLVPATPAAATVNGHVNKSAAINNNNHINNNNNSCNNNDVKNINTSSRNKNNNNNSSNSKAKNNNQIITVVDGAAEETESGKRDEQRINVTAAASVVATSNSTANTQTTLATTANQTASAIGTRDSVEDEAPSTSAAAAAAAGAVVSLHQQQFELDPAISADEIVYKEYEAEHQMHDIMRLIQAELSEPYSIYTYRYFIYNWPKLCFLAAHDNQYVGAIVCKLDMHMNVRRGYIAMLAVRKEYRKLKIGTTLVTKAIEAMLADNAHEVVLETEMRNEPALRLYENLGFVRDKRLFRYYLNGVDALRLKLWFR